MFKLIKNLIIKRRLEKASNWFDKHSPAQERFEDIEDWLEELEDRILELEANSHPTKEEALSEVNEKFEKTLKKLEEKIGQSENN